MADRIFTFFIKVGSQVHMNKLFYDGEVFCKTLKYFTEEEEETLRHDKYEGAAHISQIQQILLYTEDEKTLLGTGNNGQIYQHNEGYQGNIFCLYGFEANTINLETKEIKPLNLDMNGLNFGDSAILIFKPGEFIQRVKKEVESQGLTFQSSPVTYYDNINYQGNLSPFHKSNKFSLQNEFRFWIPNMLNKDLAFKIGNISDIATLLPKSDISKLSYSSG